MHNKHKFSRFINGTNQGNFAAPKQIHRDISEEVRLHNEAIDRRKAKKKAKNKPFILPSMLTPSFVK